MKTFKDLEFKKHLIAKSGILKHKDAKHATLEFEKGYGISVLFGSCFYSNGVDSYECAVLLHGSLYFDSGLADDVISFLSEDEVSDLMIKIQEL